MKTKVTVVAESFICENISGNSMFPEFFLMKNIFL